jgi:hypothetical protein
MLDGGVQLAGLEGKWSPPPPSSRPRRSLAARTVSVRALDGGVGVGGAGIRPTAARVFTQAASGAM